MVGIGFIDNQTRTAHQQSQKYSDINNNIEQLSDRDDDPYLINKYIVDGHYHWPKTRKSFMDQPIDGELIAKAREALRKVESSEEFKEKYCQEHYDELVNDEPAATCWRYLIYNDLNLEKAVENMKNACIIRKEYRISDLNDKMFIKEFWHWAPIGKTGKTKEGHDLIFVIGKQYKKPNAIFKDTIRRFVLNMIFSWDRAHRKDLSQMALVFDTTYTGYSNIDVDFMSWLVTLIDVMPARIAAVYVVGIPFIVRPLVKLIISWLPERFKRVTHCGTFEDLVRTNVEDHAIPAVCGGTSDDTYRIAPLDAPWMDETPIANDEPMKKAIRDCVCFAHSDETVERMRQMQKEYERTAKK